MTNSNGQSTGIDKNALYGDFRERDKARWKIFRRGALKALDLPDDEMQINSRSGISALGAVGIALAAGLPTAGLATALLLGLGKSEPQPAVQPAPETKTIVKERQIDVKVIPPTEP